MKNILVVGGAGYIGSHMCKFLWDHGYQPIVLDNLVRGHRQAVRWGPFVKGAASEDKKLKKIFSDHTIDAVMHFAAYCYVGESVKNPSAYYLNNVAETVKLLHAMVEANIQYFIFSSSCAVYGDPIEFPITETHPLKPINPYGHSKRMVEQILDDFHDAYGLKFISLRYFNAAGADPDGELGEDHRPETHLIPLVLQVALGKKEAIHIYGDDYSTEDGTCIRDYIHVNDLAGAHLLALEKLLDGHGVEKFNLGNSKGYSVREVIDIARQATGAAIPEKIVDRRPGDPPALVGSNINAISKLNWQLKYPDLHTIIETSWKWLQQNPNGYTS